MRRKVKMGSKGSFFFDVGRLGPMEVGFVLVFTRHLVDWWGLDALCRFSIQERKSLFMMTFIFYFYFW